MSDPYTRPQRQQNRLQKILGAAGRLLAQVLAAGLLFLPFRILFFLSPEEWGNNESFLALHEIAKLIVTTGSVMLVAHVIDERDLESFGLTRNRMALADIGAGLLITLLVLGLSFLIELGLGLVEVVGFAWENSAPLPVLLYILGTFLVFALVGWSEELLSRGFHLQIIEEGSNKFWAVFLSSVIFSYLHRYNPDMNAGSYFFIFLAGLVFAYAYLKTGQLWLSIGLHAGWDFFLAVGFFGIPISGLKIFHLIDLASSELSAGQAAFSFLLQVLVLIACALLVRAYSGARNRKPAPGVTLQS